VHNNGGIPKKKSLKTRLAKVNLKKKRNDTFETGEDRKMKIQETKRTKNAHLQEEPPRKWV